MTSPRTHSGRTARSRTCLIESVRVETETAVSGLPPGTGASKSDPALDIVFDAARDDLAAIGPRRLVGGDSAPSGQVESRSRSPGPGFMRALR